MLAYFFLRAISASDVLEELKDINITAQRIGSILKNLGIEVRIKKIQGKTKRVFVYNEQLFSKLKKRYIPEFEGYEVSEVTTVTERELQPELSESF